MAQRLCARALLLASSLIGAGSLTHTAKAQNTPPVSENDTGEIVVTAQRRSERIRDVPISITALTANSMKEAGIQDSRDLPLLTPGLRIDSTGTYVQPAIRGITTTLTSGPEANVATYLDGVYQPNTFGAIYNLPDVQQVEVLKGPQGTLFGRNATGGAILITTRQPSLSQVTGQVTAGLSSFRTVTLNGFASAPLVKDKVALSLAAYYEDVADGWKTNLVTGQKNGASINTGLVRGKLRFLPWEGADFTLTGLYSWRDDRSGYRTSIWNGNHDAAGTPGLIIPSAPWTYATDVDPRHNSKAVNFSLRGDIEVGPGTLTTSTAYAHSYADLVFDPDNLANGSSYASTKTDYKSFTQELVYATRQLGRFRAVAGLFFFDTKSGTSPYFVQASGFQEWFQDKGTSYAGFGEATYNITDRLSITGGLRYSYEKRKAYAALKFGQPPLISPALGFIGDKGWGSTTPRVSLLYKLTDNTNVYATYSQGFKSGIFNTPGFQTTPVNPEKVNAYEIGVKGTAMPGLRFSAAAFHYDYKDLQVPSVELVGDVLTQRILNAASARITGAEANIEWDIVRDFSLNAGLSYLDAKYRSFPDASVNVPVSQLPPPGNSQCTEAVKPTSGLCNIILDVSGRRMIRAPEWSGSLTGTFRHEFETGTFTLSGTVYASSEVFYEFADRIRQPGYAKINASAAYRMNNGVRLSLWGRNLTNQAVLTSVLSTSTYDSVDYERPREFGGTIGVEF
ncbi:MAG TPA: TonB-dependent receptor [Sphingobium sp.]|uniref:TonB-dependent receptor n=1 Tax=Sphingobium sp. TaxID=1912891 RepID=UPI002ED4B45C